MCDAKAHVRFTPNSDRESGHAQPAMSALPRKRTCAAQTPMSAKGQKRTSTRLVDHLIGARDECRGHRDAERLGGLEVNDQLELRGLLDRQITRLCTLQNFVSVARGAARKG